jgi:hypothetical protein
MTPRAVSPAELRCVLADLALVAAGFVRGRGRNGARAALLVALANANQALSAEDLPAEAMTTEASAQVVTAQAGASDAEALVCTTANLRQLAAEADAATRVRPGYRADLEG